MPLFCNVANLLDLDLGLGGPRHCILELKALIILSGNPFQPSSNDHAEPNLCLWGSPVQFSIL